MLLFGWSLLGRQLPKNLRPFKNHLVTVPKAPITIGINVTFMYYNFFNSLTRSSYLSLFSHSFSFILWSAGQQSRQFCKFSTFCWLLLGQVFWPRLGDLLFVKVPLECICIFLDSCCVVHISFVRMVKLNFLHISQWIILPTQSCLVLYSFCANLLYSLIMWLMVSSLSLHSLHFNFVVSYLFSLWYDWFLWRCFVQLLGEILFLS